MVIEFSFVTYGMSMNEERNIASELLSAAEDIAARVGAVKILVFLDGLPEKTPLPENAVIITRAGKESERAEHLQLTFGASILDVPDVRLDRAGQIDLAALLALSQDVIMSQDNVIILVGVKGSTIDTLQVVRPNEEFSLVQALGKGRSKKAVRRVVFQRVISIALELSTEGREGKSVGGFFVIGDSEKVAEHTEQLIMNPFRGYPEDMRSVLDDRLVETIKEFSTIDGAFVIRGDGVVLSAGTLIRTAMVDEDLPKGLGARHAAAAGITRLTSAVAITVSESDGTVRIWRKGKMVTELERE